MLQNKQKTFFTCWDENKLVLFRFIYGLQKNSFALLYPKKGFNMDAWMVYGGAW